MGKTFIKIITAFLVVLTMLFCFVSCSLQEEKDIKNTVSFTDALNRNVTVEKNPERVAALIGSFADVWILSGGSVCAAAEDAWLDFDLELSNAINIGGAHTPNLELLLSAKPDFVIASASTSSNVEMQSILENSGITVAYFDIDNFDDYLSMLDICTEITGRKELYEKNGTSVKKQIEDVKFKCLNSELSDNEKKILLIRASSGSVKAKGSKGTILGEMLADIGCINIADSDISILETLSIESVIRQNPYHIFVVTMGDDSQKATENINRFISENPAWGTLEAIKENRFHIMDKKLFNLKPNAKWAESYEKLSQILFNEK